MDKEQLFELLKENLSIRLSEKRDYGGEGIEVQLWFDNEKLCSDYIFTKTWQD
jgi:hypothetical protein